MSTRFTALVLVLLTWGCGRFLGLEEGVLATTIDGDGGMTTMSEVGGGGEGGSDAGGSDAGGTGGAACEERTFTVFAEADTVIIDGNCNVSNYYGGTPYGNVGIGRGLFRFPLTDELVAALSQNRMLELSLVLTRDEDCLDGPSCPAATGVLSTRPLRNDWVEGPYAFEAYMGADWCRRGSGQSGASWQAPGASGAQDAGAVSGTTAVAATDPDATVWLAPEHHAPFIDTSAGHAALSVMVVPDASVVFVVATKEELEPLEPPARLSGTFCEPH